MKNICLISGLVAGLGCVAGAQDLASETWGLPSWLSIKGETRARFESLDGQFRRNRAGSDQLLLFRSLIQVEADLGSVALGFELQDSRTYLGDSGTPLTNSISNPLDFLQIYTRLDLPGLLGPNSRSELLLGRQTVSIGSKRQIERVSFANAIKNYSGGHLTSRNDRGDELHALFVVPVAGRPDTFDDLLDNTLLADREQWHRQILGLHYRRADFLPEVLPDLWGEVFAYGLHEQDRTNKPTPNREYLTTGFRLYRAPKVGRWDLDLEGALRNGSRRATSAPNDTKDLDVSASMFFGTLGYTFEHPWQPRLAATYYWASGDKNPNDDKFDQYERLFGSRRTDLNNTSIHGPLTPANLSAPGLRVEIKPNERLQARLAYSAVSLASKTDAWIIAGLRDPKGQSGRFLGHSLDGQILYWIEPKRWQWELGGSAFFHGEFSEKAPQSPNPGTTLFGYTSLSFHF